MTDTAAPVHIYGQGRKPPHPPGHPNRLAIPWLHELDPDVAPGTPVTYPVDCTNGKKTFPMWGNGPDPTVTITDAEGAPSGGSGQPVGDCHKATGANAVYIDGNPLNLTGNIVVNNYDVYEAESQGVPLGQEQDEGVVMSDALVWELTHDWAGNVVPLGEGIVAAFIPVHPASVPATMAKYRKPIMTGVNLTNADQQTFPHWSESSSNPPNPQEGHVVLLALLRAAPVAPAIFGPGGPISWQQIVTADPSWMNACPEEFWMAVTPADKVLMGETAYNQLIGYMVTLPGFQGLKPTDPPPPAPAPAPGPEPALPPPPAPPTDTGLIAEVEAEIKAWYTQAKAWWDDHVGTKEEA